MGKLIIVPTPIGNLEDMTFRGVRVLKEAGVVLAEDTRVTKKLLSHYGISVATRSYHAHNEHALAAQVARELSESDRSYVLVSDAGTPGISDPAYLLVKACLENGVEVECLPGATAFVPALVKSGLPASSFCFEGFLPQKKGRNKKLESLKDESRTMIFYESPFRLLKTLAQFREFFGGERQVSVSREISKIFEETVNGTVDEVYTYFEEKGVKGEFVIVLAGKDE